MTHPAPTRADHRRFCETEGWERRHTVRRRTGDHLRFELALPDGRILTTRISHPVSRRDTYGPALWSTILRVDFEVDADTFWACVDDGILPDRGDTRRAEGPSMPLGLFHQLVHTVGLPEADVRRMDVAEGARALADFYTHRAD